MPRSIIVPSEIREDTGMFSGMVRETSLLSSPLPSLIQLSDDYLLPPSFTLLVNWVER